MAYILIDDAVRYLWTPQDQWPDERLSAMRRMQDCGERLVDDYVAGVRTVTELEMQDMVENLDIMLLGLGLADEDDYDWDFEWVDSDTLDGEVVDFLEHGSGTMRLRKDPGRHPMSVLGTLLHELVHIYVDVKLFDCQDGSLSDVLAQSGDTHVRLSRKSHNWLWQRLSGEVQAFVSMGFPDICLSRAAAVIADYTESSVRPSEAWLRYLFCADDVEPLLKELDDMGKNLIATIVNHYKATGLRPGQISETFLQDCLGKDGMDHLQSGLGHLNEEETPACEGEEEQQVPSCDTAPVEEA